MAPLGGEESADCASCGAMSNSCSRWRLLVQSITQLCVVDMILPYKSLSMWHPNTLLQLVPYTKHQQQRTYRPLQHKLLRPNTMLHLQFQILPYTQRQHQ